MGDGADALQQIGQALVAQGERIAAGDEHVAHGRGAGDVVDADVELGAGGGRGRVGDLAFAGAVAAVHRAVVADVKKHAIRVAVRDAGHGHVGFFGQGIFELKGIGGEFAGLRHGLQAHGAGRVVGLHEGRVVRGDGDAEQGAALCEGVAFLGSERDDLLEGFQGADAVLLLPVPAVPLLGRGVLKEGGAAQVAGAPVL